ncbi:DNA helicase UvrD, partial [Pseudoxanthomonas sp. SGD-10]
WWQSKAYDQIITSVYSQSAQKKTPRTPEGGIVKIRKVKKSDDDERTFSDTVFREYSLNYLVEEIKGLKEDRGYQYKDISVLVRSNREAVETVETLMAANIPVVSGEALLIAGNTSIKLIINTLYALAGYEENTSLYKANCIALYHKISGRPVHPHSYLNLRYKRLSDLGSLLPPDLCANANSWLQLPLPELVEKIIKAYGIAQQEVYLPYLLAFRDVIANATRQGEKGIHSFLNWWEEDGIRKALPTPEEADAVQIITIHKSKGLAFRAVFIPFCDLELSGKSNSIFWVPADGTPYKDLGSIPLKYSKELAKSTIAPYYFEEELYSHMDTLNMIYVATTRAKDFLYLGTKAKEKEDAKSLGDLLNLIYKDQFDEQESLYLEGRFLIQEEDIVLKDTIELKGYPTSDRISEIYKTEEERHANHLLNLEESGRRGSILHDILANATSEQEVESYVEDLNMEGVITVDEKDDFIQEARGVLNHPDLKQLLDKADRTIVEKGIIDITGKQHRPDKVLISNDEIIVIDYKFTVKEQESHISQLSSYKTILAEMGYSKVSAYLFYALSKTLKAV